MASHSHAKQTDEKLNLGSGASTLVIAGAVVGLIGLAAAAGISTAMYDLRRFFFAYLVAWAFFLSLGIGGLFFILIQYVTRSGWSVTVRRGPEALAKTLPLSLVLSIPILWTIADNKGLVYRWAQPAKPESESAMVDAHAGHDHAGHDHSTDAKVEEVKAEAAKATEAVATKTEHAAGEAAKSADGFPIDETHSGEVVRYNGKAYPNVEVSPVDAAGKPEQPEDHLVIGKKEGFLLLGNWTVIIRSLACLLGLSLVAWWYTSQSARQDKTGALDITERLSVRSAPMLVIFGVATTFLAFDLLMSLDPVWISTIFGGYFFAGSVVSMFASTILLFSFLQSRGYLTKSVSRDHYHDLSKFQFAFTFFWGYLAFSQFMLLWYSSQPEELTWLARRGCSTAALHLEESGPWTVVSLVLLFAHLLLPFPGLLSRHVKRSAFGRMFWAGWILVAHYIDMYWVVMPEYNGKFFFGLPEIAAFVGIGGLFIAVFVRGLANVALRPLQDPRLDEALHFHQVF